MLSVVEAETSDVRLSVPNVLTLDPWPTRWSDAGFGLFPREDAVRRGVNVLAALIGLVVALPLMVLIAVAIKLSSPGPIFYKQVRVGLDRRSPIQESANWRRRVDYGGRLFTLYKFRTMHHRETAAPQVWASKGDPRVFPLGRILRRYRLDELPQLFNVLLGDMNVVGPRPEQPEIFLDLRNQVRRYPQRQRVLPGITGLAQVNQSYDTCIDDVRRKVAYDLEYIRRQSVLEDLRIMAQTVPSVVTKMNGW